MQTPFYQTGEHDYFANDLYAKHIECVLPSAELLINFKTNGIKAKRLCLLYTEKLDSKIGLVQIRLTEKCDQRRMYITTVDSVSFAELKQEQSLHVTFSGFVDNLISLLQDCQAGKLEICIVQLTVNRADGLDNAIEARNGSGNQAEYQLQFVEVRPFKNLTHLCLPCRIAPLKVVLFYFSNILETMQKKVIENDHTVQQMQHELLLQQRRNEQLENENQNLRENLKENIHNINQRHAEEIKQLQDSIRKASDQRHNDNERNKKSISALQTQIDKLNMEKEAAQAEKRQLSKRIDSLNEQINNRNSEYENLQKEKEQLQNQVAMLKNEERKNEMHLGEARKHINELQEKLEKYHKNKADIVADLEAERKIVQKKRQALEVASEEISKANEIIYNQSQELLKLKKTIEWRTEIALQQEKALNEKEKEISFYNDELTELRIVVKSLREEIPKQLESLRQFANTLEKKYEKEINTLRDSLNSCKENDPCFTARSTTSRRQ